MDKQFLCLDSPTDFMVGKYISADELKEFINIPCKIKAGVFILCMEGQIRSTINMSELTTSKLNVVTLLPNSRIQIHEISPDILIYFIAFSFDFMCYTNFIKSTMGYLLMIYRYPIIKISQNRANLITNFYELLYQYAVYPDILNNKEMIKAIFMMCSQGIIEIYSKNLPIRETGTYTSVTNLSRVPKYGIEILYERAQRIVLCREVGPHVLLFLDIHQKSDRRDSSRDPHANNNHRR